MRTAFRIDKDPRFPDGRPLPPPGSYRVNFLRRDHGGINADPKAGTSETSVTYEMLIEQRSCAVRIFTTGVESYALWSGETQLVTAERVDGELRVKPTTFIEAVKTLVENEDP